MSHMAHALVYEAPGFVSMQQVDLPDLRPGDVHVRTLFSGLSRGTERLVFQGRVPEREWQRMRAPLQIGDFPFPVRYGYAAVGVVDAGPENLIGQRVFSLHPHQSAFRVPAHWVVPLPDSTPSATAILGANMETALNAIWDAQLRPGARVLVVGAGLLGWLIVHALSCRSDLNVVVTDIRPETGALADDFLVKFADPAAVPREGFDVAFHTSATGAGLQTALDALHFEGRVIELSWYGDTPVKVDLGGNFHANRLQIVSSQVGHVAPARRGALSHRDRLALALEHLSAPRLESLITNEVPFHALPERMADLLGSSAPGIATRIVYE